MDILTPSIQRLLILAAILVASAAPVLRAEDAPAPDVALKAAFLYNFAKFTEWPALPPGAPIVFCIVNDEAIATALVAAVSGQNISGHRLVVARPQDTTAWPFCQMLFITDPDVRRSAAALDAIESLPILSVSDAGGFAQADGTIELFVEEGRMRFAINVDAAGRSGLHLSSRLLGLAKIVRSRNVQ